MRIVINREACDGNGLCVAQAPQLLTMADDDELILLEPEFGEDQLDNARRAARVCPKAALSIAP